MQKNRRKIICGLLAAPFAAGCVYTPRLWDEKQTYRERVKGFYLVENKNQVIVSGEKFGYIFTISNELSRALQLSREIEFDASYSTFELTTSNELTGTITLSAKTNELAPAQIDVMKNLGFVENRKPDRYALHTVLLGSRYEIDGSLPTINLESQVYVTVEQPDGISDVARKIVVTPGTIVMDGVLGLGVVTFIVLVEKNSCGSVVVGC